MQESSSSEKPQQSRTRSPSSLSNTSWISLSESPSQVDLINTALTSARTLHRVRSGRLESSDSPIHRQVLERALSRQLGKRLSQLSLPSSNQESLSEETPTSTQNSQTRCPDPTRPNTETSPRTSSPLNPNLTHYLAPQTPTSPSSSFETVFFPNNSLPIAPIGEAILPIALVTVDLSDTPTPSESLVSEAMAVLDDEEKKLKGIVRKIKAKIDSSPIDDLIDVEMIPQYKSKQDELVSLLEDLHQGVAEICEEYEAQLGATRLNAWTTTLTETRTKVSQYKKNVVAEIKNLRQASDSAGSTSGAAVPQSLNSTVEQERLSFDKDKQLKQEKRVQAEAETRCKAVTEDATRFAKKFPINSSDWCSEENNKVEAAMKDIHNWEKEMQALRKEAREVEILVTGHSLADTDGNIGHMKTRVDDTVKLLDRTIKQIKELDSVRNLNSLSAKKTDFVKLPKYGGKPDEDFIVFKKKMEKGFVSNNIPTDDQVEKLRENLLDAAKIIVPENTDTIERAWDLLQAAYGSEDRLMQTRKDKLAAMGHLPEAGLLAKGGHSKRVTWCLELERVLADIIELGNRSDELAKEAFSKSSIDVVIKMFPPDRGREMIRLPGTGCNKLDGIVEIVETERQLYQVGMKVKEWGFTGTAPSEKTSADGRTVSFGGMLWDPMLDTLEPKIPPCHFGTVARGRVKIGTEIFGGSMENDMEKFVPSKITPRQVSSKYLSFYDILQLFMPVTAGMKRDLRRVMKETDGWDTAISVELRSKWVKNLWIIEKLKGMKFGRAKMPEDAVSEEMRMLVLVDAAKTLIVVGVWVGFQRKSGEWSCSYLIGRCLLTAEDSTTPKDELNGLTVGGNICYLVRNSLLNWVTTYAVCCDSTIALHWAKSNKLKLSLFHRNRVVQVRRTIDLDNIYHVVTDKNLADLPTRPDKVDLSDVGPLSTWHSGLEWMRDDLKKAIDDKTITPLDKLSMPEEDKEDFEKGFVYEKTKDILTRGHIVTIVHCGVTLNKERIDLVYSRAAYTGYLILPTKFHFPAIVRIMGIVWRFIKSFKCLKGKLKTKPTFNMLSATGGVCSEASMTAAFASNVQSEVQALAVDESNNKKAVIIPTDEDISDALTYLFRVATKEVKEFVKPEIIKKIAVESQGILYSKSRVMDGQRFTLSGDMKDSRILANQGIIIHTPLVERFSPLAYSIGHYVHENLARHSGYETCNRTSLGFCLILKGIGLYEELGNECTTCKKLRKRFIEVSMGPVSSHQFAVCPLFWVTQGDLFGPLTHYVPGRERNTRRTPALDSKCYAFVMVCVVTKLVNIQIVETKDVGGISCALTRLGCEIGMPKLFLTDKDSGIMATLKGVKLELLDVKLRINKEHGVRFETCPVAGHNAHGLVERKIKTAQELMDKCGIANARMHTTGLQTTAKLVENMMNNTPYGYSYGRSQTNTKLMKLVSPNMMKIGRIHSRTINAPVKLPDGPATMMDKVEKAYNVFYKLYNDTMVAKLIQETNAKWFRSSEDLKVDDVVYFRKAEGSVIKGEWTVGAVESVKFGRDGLVREATVKYCNPSENIPRYTTRAARSLVRLFNVEDCHWKTDMEEVRKMLKTMNINAVVEDKPDDATDDTRKTDTLERDPTLCKCCCESHCSLSLHVSRGVALVKQSRFKQPEVDLGLSVKQPGWDYRVDELDDYIGEEMSLANAEDNFANDTVMGLMTALNMDLS